jgi:hypothetical protein
VRISYYIFDKWSNIKNEAHSVTRKLKLIQKLKIKWKQLFGMWYPANKTSLDFLWLVCNTTSGVKTEPFFFENRQSDCPYRTVCPDSFHLPFNFINIKRSEFFFVFFFKTYPSGWILKINTACRTTFFYMSKSLLLKQNKERTFC